MRLLAERAEAGLARVGSEFAAAWAAHAGESVLLFATATAGAAAAGGSDFGWRLDLGAGTLAANGAHESSEADWSITGTADAWERVLTGRLNLALAFRRGELRYGDRGDLGAGSAGADARVAMLAELLAIIRWRPAGTPADTTGPAAHSAPIAPR